MICLYLCFLFSSPLQLTHFSLQQSSMAQKSNDIHEIGEKPFERKQTVKTVWNQADKICSCMFPFHLNTHTHTRFPCTFMKPAFWALISFFSDPGQTISDPHHITFIIFFLLNFIRIPISEITFDAHPHKLTWRKHLDKVYTFFFDFTTESTFENY